jgi:hypothetical protein
MVWLPLRGFSSICASVPLLGGLSGRNLCGTGSVWQGQPPGGEVFAAENLSDAPQAQGRAGLDFSSDRLCRLQAKNSHPVGPAERNTTDCAKWDSGALSRVKTTRRTAVAAPSGVPVFAIGIRPSRYPGMFFRSSALVGYLRMKNRRRSMASIGLWPARPRRMTLILCSSSGVRRSSSRRVPERKMSTAG